MPWTTLQPLHSMLEGAWNKLTVPVCFCWHLACTVLIEWSGLALGDADNESGSPRPSNYRTARGRCFPWWPPRTVCRAVLLSCFLVGSVLWVTLDINIAGSNKEGFYPGLKDATMVTSDATSGPDGTRDPTSAEATLRDENGNIKGRCYCTCEPPFEVAKNPLVKVEWSKLPDYAEVAWLCDESIPGGGEGRVYAARLAAARLNDAMAPPDKEFLLDRESWAARLYNDAVVAAADYRTGLYRELSSRVNDTPGANLTKAANPQRGAALDLPAMNATGIHQAIGGMEDSLRFIYFNALGLKEGPIGKLRYYGSVKDAFDCTLNKTRMAERNFHVLSECPISLSMQIPKILCNESHPEVHNATPQDWLDWGYDEYRRWCNASMCTCFKPQSPYQKVVGAVAILGGVYSVCTVVMFISWLLLYRLYADWHEVWSLVEQRSRHKP